MPFNKSNLIALSLFFVSFLYSTNTGLTFHNNSQDWQSINYWGYQLQNIDLTEINESSFDLIVIDYSSDGTNETAWNNQDIKLVTSHGKLLLCYISIGEAEDYRFYWDDSWNTSPPEWLDEENPDWKGNYKVKFWMEGWQSLIYQYLDIIINQGFNGVYLDIIDAYEYYEEKGMANADQLMIDFVYNISTYTRAKAGFDFGIFPQNGDDLLQSSTYRSFVSGIGIEDLYFFDDSNPNDPAEITKRESNLDLLVQENKPVLTVDYVQSADTIIDVVSKTREKGYIPYCTVRELDILTPPPQTSISSHTTLFPDVVFLTTILVISIRKNTRSRKLIALK
ncbi:MAG: MJ1477/TM1410 family putative glycoside hydrolase [Candidatus Hodarchaeales archaeon]